MSYRVMPEILLENLRRENDRKDSEYLANKYGKELQDFLKEQFGENYEVTIKLLELNQKVPSNSKFGLLVTSDIHTSSDGERLMFVGEHEMVRHLTSSNYITVINDIISKLEKTHESELRKASEEQNTNYNRGTWGESRNTDSEGQNGAILPFNPKS